jgi:hypothetical protein
MDVDMKFEIEQQIFGCLSKFFKNSFIGTYGEFLSTSSYLYIYEDPGPCFW